MKKSFETIERTGVPTKNFSSSADDIVLKAHQEKHVSFYKVNEWRGRMDENGKTEFQVIVQIGRKLLHPKRIK